ncbi:hypothetical protein F2Q69_00055187 [Brassica cretica]|uniref:CCHC-type domain-containing protein n=1 Tax=Brassica cretica TaxID=69181 RepID=A0A8S9MYS5_BRACR|nr:hypothetical protein F2Q69_00055187 [Brassica cretica]
MDPEEIPTDNPPPINQPKGPWVTVAKGKQVQKKYDAAGVPDHFHPETLACTHLDVAKVFVLADLSKELPDKINYVIQGKDTIVQFIYPWLPPKCVKCGRWGHFDTFCKQNKGEKRVEEVGEGSTSVGKEGNKVEEGSEGKNKVEENPGNGWKEVSMEKVGRSPKSQLNQVIITTPSRYEALRLRKVLEGN